MSGVPRRARGTDAARLRFLVVHALLIDLVLAVGALAAWPIYRSASFVVAVAVGVVAGHAVALAGLRWRWSGWWVALAALGVYAVIGLPVGSPDSLGSPAAAVRGLLDVLTAPVTGWKDLLTLELPLGSYQATLAPVLLVFLASATAALSCAWRARRMWVLSVPVALIPTVFGVVFGARSLTAPVSIGPLQVQPETVVGSAALLAALGVVVWRTRTDRRRALDAAVAATGVRTTGSARRGLAGRAAVATGMLAIASTGAAVWGPWALADQPRNVARTAVAPVLELERALSPLAQYRAFFADDRYDEVLFSVDAPDRVDRMRLATLPAYDGRTVRATAADAAPGDPAASFTRVPSRLGSGGAPSAQMRVEIAAWSDIWAPTAGRLDAIEFEGARAADLADGFFHNASTGSAIEIADPGFEAGDAYRLTAVLETERPALASLRPARSGPALPESVVPESLREWVDAQGAPAGGAGLELLIDRLRARGFLSHALLLTGDTAPRWLADLGGDAFQPSRAGHSTDRIGDLFAQLLDREREVGAAEDAALVAAVGDDEQFAVAGMLLADHLGFDARVVVGTRLSSDQELPACEDGTCRGGDLAAWIEVQDASGAWVPVDVTPQHESFPSPEVEQRQDPENPTDVRRENAEAVLPAEANPSDGADPGDDARSDTADLTGLWTALRIGGLSLLGVLLLFGPLAVILAAKAVRRRRRRRSADVVERFTGGWQEYVDTAVDHGYPAPRSHTRQELAALYAADGAGEGVRLATWADRSVFDVAPPSDAETEEFWRIVQAERARFAAQKGFWARLGARLSLRSLMRRDPAGARGRTGRR